MVTKFEFLNSKLTFLSPKQKDLAPTKEVEFRPATLACQAQAGVPPAVRVGRVYVLRLMPELCNDSRRPKAQLQQHLQQNVYAY